jgi:hypothetical protein
MGLYHEWNRELCGTKGITCSTADDYNSVMGYFNQGTAGVQGVVVSKQTMDSYSPMDIAWLEKVYKPNSVTPGPLPKVALDAVQLSQPVYTFILVSICITLVLVLLVSTQSK